MNVQFRQTQTTPMKNFAFNDVLILIFNVSAPKCYARNGAVSKNISNSHLKHTENSIRVD